MVDSKDIFNNGLYLTVLWSALTHSTCVDFDHNNATPIPIMSIAFLIFTQDSYTTCEEQSKLYINQTLSSIQGIFTEVLFWKLDNYCFVFSFLAPENRNWGPSVESDCGFAICCDKNCKKHWNWFLKCWWLIFLFFCF